MLRFRWYFKNQNSFADTIIPCNDEIGIKFHNSESFKDKLKIIKSWLWYLDIPNKNEVLKHIEYNYYELDIPLVVTDLKWNSASKKYEPYIPEGKINGTSKIQK